MLPFKVLILVCLVLLPHDASAAIPVAARGGELPSICEDWPSWERINASTHKTTDSFRPSSTGGNFTYTLTSNAEFCRGVLMGGGGGGGNGASRGGGAGQVVVFELRPSSGKFLDPGTAFLVTLGGRGLAAQNGSDSTISFGGSVLYRAAGGLSGAHGGSGFAGGGGYGSPGVGGSGGSWIRDGSTNNIANGTGISGASAPGGLAAAGNMTKCLRSSSSQFIVEGIFLTSPGSSGYFYLASRSPNRGTNTSGGINACGGSGASGIYTLVGYNSGSTPQPSFLYDYSISGVAGYGSGCGGGAGGEMRTGTTVTGTGGSGCSGAFQMACFVSSAEYAQEYCQAPPAPAAATCSQFFNASGTFTVPSGGTGTQLHVMVIGGGAAGEFYNQPAGQGGHVKTRRIRGLLPGQQIPVVVGAAGRYNGGSRTGGSSSFGSYVLAKGGSSANGDILLTAAGGSSGGTPTNNYATQNSTAGGVNGASNDRNVQGQGNMDTCLAAFSGGNTLSYGQPGLPSPSYQNSTIANPPWFYLNGGPGGAGGIVFSGELIPQGIPPVHPDLPANLQGTSGTGYGAGGGTSTQYMYYATTYTYGYGTGGSGTAGAVYVECHYIAPTAFTSMTATVPTSYSVNDGSMLAWLDDVAALMGVNFERLVVTDITTGGASKTVAFMIEDDGSTPCSITAATAFSTASGATLNAFNLTFTVSISIVSDRSNCNLPPTSTASGSATSASSATAAPGSDAVSSDETASEDFPLTYVLAAAGGCLLIIIIVIVIVVVRRRSKSQSVHNSDIALDAHGTFLSSPQHGSYASATPGGHMTYSSMPTPGSATPAAGGSYSSMPTPPGMAYHDLGTGAASVYSHLDVLSNPKMRKLDLDISKLARGPQIGRGAYGVVYRGTYSGQQVAIKHMLDDADAAALKEFTEEANLMKAIPRHANVVNLVGLAKVQGEGIAIVTEFCAGSSLLNAVQHEALAEDTLWVVVRGMAAGMAHLAANHIVHRDLACRNVLLTEDWTPKISDFGMSRQRGEGGQDMTKSNTGPIKWMAPEAMKSLVYSEKSDVWMFGCTVIEAVSRTEPFPNMSAMEVGSAVIFGTLVPSAAPGTPPAMISTINACFAFDPQDRPTFKAISNFLRG